MGMVARKMETAPRNPAQETNIFSRQEKLNGHRHWNTPPPRRATNMRKAAKPSAGGRNFTIWAGESSRPSITNMTIWHSHVTVSWKL